MQIWNNFIIISFASSSKIRFEKFLSTTNGRNRMKIKMRTHASSSELRGIQGVSFQIEWRRMNWKHILMLMMQVNGKLNIPRADSILWVIFNSINWRKNVFDPIVAECAAAVHIPDLAFNLPSTQTRPKAEKLQKINATQCVKMVLMRATRMPASNPQMARIK